MKFSPSFVVFLSIRYFITLTVNSKLVAMEKFIVIYLLFVLFVIFGKINGQFDGNMTLQNVFGHLPDTSAISLIQCTSSITGPESIKFGRTVNTGQGTKRPKYSQQFIQDDSISSRRIFWMPAEGGLTRVGAFHCEVVKNVTTRIVALKLPPKKLTEIQAVEPYKVVNKGEDVDLMMEIKKKPKENSTIKWRHNGGNEIKLWENQLSVHLTEVDTSDAGIYECYFQGRRGAGVHGLMRLIVRACEAGKYGDSCENECPLCYNGGVCHDKWGVCICPPGFTGPRCEKACGGNYFGSTCTTYCSPPGEVKNPDDGCAVHLFCKPDPYGCSCASGFKGPNCDEVCEPGFYGADCKQKCRCQGIPNVCNRITGSCGKAGCLPGWTGDSCAIEVSDDSVVPRGRREFGGDSPEYTDDDVHCPLKKFGPPECAKSCHCLHDVICNPVTGWCPSGCAEGWVGDSCSECVDPGHFGDNCEFECGHCAGGFDNCDKENNGSCSEGCEAGWTGITCLQACDPGRFGANCDETCACENGGHCDPVNGICTCEGKWQGANCTESAPQIIAAPNGEVNVGQEIFVSCTVDAIPEPDIKIFMNSELLNNKTHYRVRKMSEESQYQAVMQFVPNEVGTLHLNCSAENKHGYDMNAFSVLVIKPPSLLTPPEVLEITNTSAKIGWHQWEFGDDEGGKATDRVDYKVVYRKHNSSEWIDNMTNWESGLSSLVVNLEPDTEYEFAVKCRRPGKGGEGSPSPSVVMRTYCGTPAPGAIPQEFATHTITATSVTLSWKAPLHSELHCSIEEYKLRYRQVADPNANHYVESFKYQEIPGNEQEFVLGELLPNTLYDLQLFVKTTQGLGDQYAQLQVMTMEGVPGPVQNLKFEHLMEPDLLLVTWDEVLMKNGKLQGYTVTSQLLNKSQCIVNHVVTTDASDGGLQNTRFTIEKTITLTGLLPFSTYLVTVRASTSAGFGEPESFHVTTLEAKPSGPPENVRMSNAGTRELTFEWNSVDCEEANGKIIKYEYKLMILNEQRKQAGQIVKRSTDVNDERVISSAFTTDPKAEIKDLTPYMLYSFAVRAYTSAGAGPFSESLETRTAQDAPPPPTSLTIIDIGENEAHLQWKAPDPPFGIIDRYNLQYFAAENNSSLEQIIVNVIEQDQLVVKYILKNLKSFTNYSVQVQGATEVGWGMWSEQVTFQTKVGLPGPPTYLHLVSKTDTSLEIGWQPPELFPDFVTEYRVSYRPLHSETFENDSFPSSETISIKTSEQKIILEDLIHASRYEVEVEAATQAGFGPSATAEFWTEDTGNVTSPELSITKKMPSSLIVSFIPMNSSRVLKYQIVVEESQPDAAHYSAIDEAMLKDYETAMNLSLPYYIAVEIDAKDLPWGTECYIIVGDGRNISGFYNAPLKPLKSYNIRVRAIKKDGKGVESASLSSPVTYKPEDREMKIWGMYWLYFILLFLFTLICLILLISGFLYLIHHVRNKRRKYPSVFKINVDGGNSEMMTWAVAYRVPEIHASDGTLVCSARPVSLLGPEVLSTCRANQRRQSSTYVVNVDDLADYVETKLGHPIHNFAEEFQKLPSGQISEWTAAKKPENVKKNRYGNVLPYDNNRVLLKPALGVTSDYINASYIKGYNLAREYITTQGPMDHTTNEFWQMVWQENASVIVMVTALFENGKRKCAKYWPDDSSVFGDLSILLIYTEPFVDFILRTFLLKKLSTGETRRVLHYQYLDWPNGPLPFNTSSLLHMQQRIRMQSLNNHGPFIVHCSAGVGRAGTFIAVDTIRQQAEEEKKVDVFSTVRDLRLQRNGMVQTLEQYIFIYETVLEATQCGNTAVSTDEFSAYLRELCRLKSGTDKSKLEHQYLTLGKMKKAQDTRTLCSEALHETNIYKNRDPMIVPTDTARLKLKGYTYSIGQELAPDYINAVCVNGYKQRTVFLVTHMPLEETVIDFWQMIYEYNSSLIIMLDATVPPVDNPDATFGQYWPEGGSCLYGPYEVQVVTFEDLGSLHVRIMKLINNLMPDEEPHRVIQLQFMDWASGDTLPSSPASVLSLLNQMEQWYRKTKGGPITVHCWDGATRCGLFCAASYITDQIKCEHMIDVFHAVKRIRLNREEFIPNVEQYKFCYEISAELIESLSKYSNFKWSSY